MKTGMKISNVLLLGIGTSVSFVVLFLYPFIRAIDKPFGSHDDVDQAMFVVANGYEKFSKLDFTHLYDSRMYYPNRQTITSGNSMLLASVLGMPVYMISKNAVLSFNATIVLNFFLSFLAMYILAYYLTKNVGAASVAGLVYAYNPYVSAHFLNIELNVLFLLPLLFLASELFVRTGKMRYGLMVIVFFTMQVYSSPYYAFFAGMCLPVYTAIRARSLHVKLHRLFQGRMVFLAVALVGLVYISLMPYLSFRQSGGLQPDREFTQALSAELPDYLSTSPANRLYGWIIQTPFFSSLRSPYAAVHPTEHSLFPGITTLVLLCIAIGMFWNRKFAAGDRSILAGFIAVMGLAFVLSFGLYGPYTLLYSLVPLVSAFRAVSRFGVMVFLSLSVVGAFVMSKIRIYAVIMVLMLLTAEFSFQLPRPVVIDPGITQFYSWLRRQPTVHVIVELPMVNNLPDVNLVRSPSMDTQYLLYGIYHDKYIVNGYNSFIPQGLIDFGNQLSINFPTEVKLQTLRSMGVDTVIIHLEEYRNPLVGKDLVSKLQQLNLKQIYSSGSIHAFAL